jgi:hypothetical protein
MFIVPNELEFHSFSIVKGVDDSRDIICVWSSKEEVKRDVTPNFCK